MPVVIILLVLIFLVLAWPVVVAVLVALTVLIGANWQIIALTIAAVWAYMFFLSRTAKKYNIKLGGKYGEPLDPSKPIGPPASPDQKRGNGSE